MIGPLARISGNVVAAFKRVLLPRNRRVQNFEERFTHLGDDVEAPSRPKKGEDLATTAISMLDIIACGLGGVVLIAIINMVILIPSAPILSNNFILYEVHGAGVAEVGFEVQAPSGITFLVWRDTELAMANGFVRADQTSSGPVAYVPGLLAVDCPKKGADADCGVVATIYIEEPAVGDWYIRPYLASSLDEESSVFHSIIKNVQCFLWTKERAAVSHNQLCRRSGETNRPYKTMDPWSDHLPDLVTINK